MNALAEQIAAVACLAHRVAVLSYLGARGLIRVMDDSSAGPSLNQQRHYYSGGNTGFYRGLFYFPAWNSTPSFPEGIYAAHGCQACVWKVTDTQ